MVTLVLAALVAVLIFSRNQRLNMERIRAGGTTNTLMQIAPEVLTNTPASK